MSDVGSHLSDEAVAAFADGVLRGHARGRAARHVEQCAECRQAVREQREAVFALRQAPAPPLPAGLFERLQGLPNATEPPAADSPAPPGPGAAAPWLQPWLPTAALTPSPERGDGPALMGLAALFSARSRRRS